MTSDDSTSQTNTTQSLLRHAVSVARDCHANAIFVYSDALENQQIELDADHDCRLIYITKSSADNHRLSNHRQRYIRVPDVNLSRFGQVKIAMFLALSSNLIQRDDTVVCLTGSSEKHSIDTLFVTKVGDEFDSMAAIGTSEYLPEGVSAEVIDRIVAIAAELGSEGREGKAVGALFVIGDAERVVSLSKQLIINPFRGYSGEERNVLDPALEETVKELSTIDGAFILRGDGIIETCGAYLKTSLRDEEEYSLPRGLGARHHSAAGVTAVTNSVAVAVSESTGTVTIFANGKIVTELEKLRAGTPR
ncbi:DNA integrity scanning protein DisA nucleotide-binding domain protein [Novipirellula aureliae]|nr:diadenylate cyclase [Novipirellula aureliae]